MRWVKSPEDAHNFSPLIVAEHLQLMVDLVAVRWFDKGDRTCFGSAQGRAPHFSFVCAGHSEDAPLIEVAFGSIGPANLVWRKTAGLCRTAG